MIEGTGLKAVFSLERAEPRLGGATGLAEEMEEALGGEQEALELLEELPSLGGVEAGAGAGEGAGWVTGGGAGARAKGRVVCDGSASLDFLFMRIAVFLGRDLR